MSNKESYEALSVAELLIKMHEKIDALTEEVRCLRRQLPVKDTMQLSEIARMLGVATTTLYTKPWNLPNWGVPDVGNNPRRWFRATVTAWFATTEADRRARWESMTDAEKLRALAA